MDGFPFYQQPANGRWLRMLFLTTGFVIGGMCLWAFVQKQSQQRATPEVATPRSAASDRPANAAHVLQESPASPAQPWQQESPARAAIESARPWQRMGTNPAESPEWQAEQFSIASQASFEVSDTRPVHVSKPPLNEEDLTIPLPEFSPLATDRVEEETQSIEASLEIPSDQDQQAPVSESSTAGVPLADSIITQANDSFWLIAQRVYGDPRYYAALFEHNRNWIAYPDRIEQGFRVMTPPVEELHARYAELCPDSRR